MDKINIDKVKTTYQCICKYDAYIKECKDSSKKEYDKGVIWGYEYGVMRTQFFRTLNDAIIEESKYDSYVKTKNQNLKRRRFIK